MRFVVALFACAVLACTHPSGPAEVVAITPAPPAVSTSVPAMATSLTASKAPAEKILIGGELVDLDTMTPRKLTGDTVLDGAIGDDTAYLWVRKPAGNELRAYDATSGHARWSVPATECASLTASALGGFCSTSMGLKWFRRADGSARPIAAPLGVSATASLGGRVVVLHTNNSLDAFDADGSHLGTTTAPVSADHAFANSTIAVAGSLACGSHRAKATTTVFCFDATPRIAWTRTVAVPSGSIRQADKDVLVIASDGWSGTGAESEIVRTSDGTSLLHMKVRLGAALTTGGVLDGALSSDPDITLWDAKGSKLWSSPQSSHHDALRAVRIGGAIAVAMYSPIATGTQLVGLDAGSGAITWRGNVDSLPIGHSEYWNEVSLRMRGKTLLLLGHEASQEYAQTFDGSGRRIGSVVRGR